MKPTNIIIRKPQKNELSEIKALFKVSIKDAFNKNGINNIDNENSHIEKQISQVKDYLEKRDKSDYLIALHEGRIIGIMAIGEPTEIHIEHLGFEDNAPLLRSAYVFPDYQGKGVGTMLFDGIIDLMKKKHIKSFYIDAGYRKSQGYWIKKLGEPHVTLKKYFQNDDDFLLWKIDINPNFSP